VPRARYRTPRAAPQPKHASDEYTEVRQAFKRILTSKASVSNQMEPWKMELGKQLSRNRVAKEDQHMKMEHAREIQHLHRRINQSHSLAERRKNKNDATLYPALLLRKSSSTPPGELWRQAAAAKSASPRGTPRGGVGSRSATSLHERPASARARTGGTSPRTARPARAAAASAAAKPPSRPQSARARKPGESVAAPLAPRGGAAGGAPPDATLPEAALGEPKDQYGAMREVVLHRIVEARLYREVDLRRFLKQARPPCHAPALPARAPAHAAASPTLAHSPRLLSSLRRC